VLYHAFLQGSPGKNGEDGGKGHPGEDGDKGHQGDPGHIGADGGDVMHLLHIVCYRND